MSKARSRTRFTVKGRYPFPMDMLRYDSCWPSTGGSVVAIYNSITSKGDCERTVTLMTDMVGITPDRWKSFGWTVTEQERV